MAQYLGTTLVAGALFLDVLSYYQQIRKTRITKKSNQVSSSSFLYKIAKAFCALGGLALYSNWVGFAMECFMLVVYVVSLAVIAHHKPKGWSLFESGWLR
jgi:hypothetical protein